MTVSNVQNDSGLFELNFKDGRYLPFEGCGAISSWRLELPTAVKQFDYNTISDVVIHLKYTARFDSSLKSTAAASVQSFMNQVAKQSEKVGLFVLINLKHDFPMEWNNYIKDNAHFKFRLDKNRFPYFVGTNPISVTKANIYIDGIAISTGQDLTSTINGHIGNNEIDLTLANMKTKTPFLIVQYTF